MRKFRDHHTANERAAAPHVPFFTQVDYRRFRECLAGHSATHVKGKGYETSIYNNRGDLLAIVHAASIDEHGRCHPAQYYIATHWLEPHLQNVA